MTRVAYLDATSGIAGDMVVGALLDAGAAHTALDRVVDALGLHDVRIEVGSVLREGIAGTRVQVRVPDARDANPGRPAPELMDVVGKADLPMQVRSRALDALQRLASAEGQVHGVAFDEVILHELGGVDTLVDLCGAFMLLDTLGVERVVCSPLPYARAATATIHGVMPAPGPAVLELLEGAPVVGVPDQAELITPTGAVIAVVASDAWGELPAMTLDRVGYGAGERDLPGRANLLRVVIGTSTPSPKTNDVILLETNLDDLLPELVPDALERCRAAGAVDVWTVPAQMKKGRPGVMVSALARPADERAVVTTLLEHTSTLGVRATPMRRYELDREECEVRVEGYSVRVKIGRLDGRVVNVAPEHDDCAAIASLTGLPVKRIWAATMAAAEVIAEPIPGGHGPSV